MNGTINELKQGLLKCANENEDRTYFTGQVVISSICKDAKDTIEELEQENEQLKTDLEYAKVVIKDLLNNSHEYSRQNAEDFIKGEGNEIKRNNKN